MPLRGDASKCRTDEDLVTQSSQFFPERPYPAAALRFLDGRRCLSKQLRRGSSRRRSRTRELPADRLWSERQGNWGQGKRRRRDLEDRQNHRHPRQGSAWHDPSRCAPAQIAPQSWTMAEADCGAHRDVPVGADLLPPPRFAATIPELASDLRSRSAREARRAANIRRPSRHRSHLARRPDYPSASVVTSQKSAKSLSSSG